MASKYDKAVDEARSRDRGEVQTITKQDVATVTIDESALPAGMVVGAGEHKQFLADKIKSGEWEQAPQLFTLKKGQTLIALLEGNGIPAEFVDEDTGVVKLVQTWILSRDGIRVSILSTIQLDKKLPPFLGGLVSITRGEDVRNGVSLYTEYLVAGPRRSDGSTRDWSSRPQLAAGPSSEPNGVKAS